MDNRDPLVRRWRVPLKDRPSFYLTIILLCLTLLSYWWLTQRLTDESKHRTSQLQDVICGVYVPIGQIPITVTSTPQLKTIVAATHHGAISIHCPGAR